MGIFFVYILKTSLCLAVFYLFYRLLLSKETFHRFNRWALLGMLLLSCVIPLIEVTTHEATDMSQPFLSLEEMLVMAEPAPVMEEVSTPFPWRALLLLVYLVGIGFFFVRHLWSLGRMLRLLRASKKESMEDGITLYIHEDKNVAPFSWMNNIAISKDDLEENGDAVLTHERAHIRNRHSWDLLLAEGCIFFQWFNPAAWLLKQELQTVHEYEADEWVIENGIDAKTYQLLIIKKAVGARLYSIANSFNHSSLKKRITMMIKKKSNPWARLKYLYVLPLAAVAVAAFARPEVSNELAEISTAKVNDLVSVVETIGEEKNDSAFKGTWHEAVPVTTDTVERLTLKLEVGQKPLFVIDGVPFGTNLTLDDIDATKVESATLMEKSEAVKLYGEKAKDGAIVITSTKPELTKVYTGVKFNASASDEKFNISGQVWEYPAKKPVPGASIIIRGTTMGTLTDKDGKFTLPVKKGDVLVVSYIGLQTQSVVVQADVNLGIWMKEDVQPMEEMVVVGQTPKEEVKYTKVEVEETEEPQEKVIFQVVEEMPEFPGGMSEAMKFLAKNIKYPVAAQQAKIEGRVIVQFVVERDGSISDIHAMRSVSPELDAEAIRVVSLMPKWKPGKQRGKAVAVKYTMPIMFRLQSPAPKNEEAASIQHINLKVDKDADSDNVDLVKNHLRNRNPGMIFHGPENKSPLIVVDGEVKGYGKDILSKIPHNQIQSITVLKDATAVAEFGDKAKDGVIKITTKKKEN
ncbi:MAG: TonB family protein [Bacteroides sp.]|nr:TonB family protein [Bacteroides sp.]